MPQTLSDPPPHPRLSKRSASQARHVTRRLARIWETAKGHLAAHAGPLDLAEISSSSALTRSQDAGLKSQPLLSAAERGKRRLVRSRSVFLVCAFCQNTLGDATCCFFGRCETYSNEKARLSSQGSHGFFFFYFLNVSSSGCLPFPT